MLLHYKMEIPKRDCANMYTRIFFRAGARFSKLPVITGSVKLFWFPFQIRVSKGLKVVQQSYQLKKQNGLHYKSEHALLFLRLWFQNMISGPLSYRVFRETGPCTLITSPPSLPRIKVPRNISPSKRVEKYESRVNFRLNTTYCETLLWFVNMFL